MVNICEIDYVLKDGIVICDYIYVFDFVFGYLVVFNYFCEYKFGVCVWNLGFGCGSIVFEMIKVFSKVVGWDLLYEVVGRR